MTNFQHFKVVFRENDALLSLVPIETFDQDTKKNHFPRSKKKKKNLPGAKLCRVLYSKMFIIENFFINY